jgi:hypothetical protein
MSDYKAGLQKQFANSREYAQKSEEMFQRLDKISSGATYQVLEVFVNEWIRGRACIIPSGEYYNRYGRITSAILDVEHRLVNSAHVSNLRILVLIQPYDLKKKDGTVLWDRDDARRYYDLKKCYKTLTDESVVIRTLQRVSEKADNNYLDLDSSCGE